MTTLRARILRPVTRLLIAVALTAMFTACSPGGAGPDAAASQQGETAAHGLFVARSDRDVQVHASPDDPDRLLTLPATTPFGSPRALLVTATGEDGGWVEVQLPLRPHGRTGWIRTDTVRLEPLSVAVEVDLAARTLTVLDTGRPILTVPAAVGDADHPTPVGRFYVTDKLDTGDPAGPYGPFALGLSAWSDVLDTFAGGDGQIGIHGTDDPASIGQAVSHGCLRVHNDVVMRLAQLLPLGTPVTIR